MRTLCQNFLLFYGNLTVFSILFWNFMIIKNISRYYLFTPGDLKFDRWRYLVCQFYYP